MADKTNLNTSSIDVYLSKQESLVIEFIRRALQAETKIAMLEEALTQAKQKLESVTAQSDACASTLDQSIAGLQALQTEKEQYKNEVSRLSADITQLRLEIEAGQNLKTDVSRLSTELETRKSNYQAIVKANEALSNELEQAKSELDALKSSKQVKSKVKDKPSL